MDCSCLCLVFDIQQSINLTSKIFLFFNLNFYVLLLSAPFLVAIFLDIWLTNNRALYVVILLVLIIYMCYILAFIVAILVGQMYALSSFLLIERMALFSVNWWQRFALTVKSDAMEFFPFGPFSQQVLNPISLTYNPQRRYRWLKLSHCL